ncbi:MAG TPA: AI-2E family transporter [Saprospiraceae bacterium]|nr:AI-2E family transporter [Saprospiraceae bacterium]
MLATQDKTPDITKFLITVASLVIIAAGIKGISSTLNIVLFSVLIAQCLFPLVSWFQKKKISPGISVLITILLVIITGATIISVMGSAVQGIREKMPEYAAHISQSSSGLQDWLKSKGYDSSVATNDATDPEKVKAMALTLLGGLASMIANGVFVLILVIVLLVEFQQVMRKSENREYPEGSILYRLGDINKTSSKFIGITALIGLLQGIASTIVLLILGVDFAVMWGVLFFFFNFVPVVGFLMALIPPVLIAFLEKDGNTALIVFGSWYALNIFFDNVVRPKLLKKGFDVSFLSILFVLLFWSFVLGPSGAILAVPLSLSLKMLYDAYMEKPATPPA